MQIARKVNRSQRRTGIDFKAQVQNVIVVHHPSTVLRETEKKETQAEHDWSP